MKTDTQRTIVQLLDKTYPIKCPTDSVADLQQSASYLNQKMREIQRANQQFTLDRIAITAALNICYELLLAKREKAKGSHSTNDELQALQSIIDDALTEQEELVEAGEI